MAKANPFIPPGKDYGAVDTEGRLRALEDFNLEQCHAALEVLGLQATVEKKLRIRIRALEKLATSDKSPAMAQPSPAPELERPEVSGYLNRHSGQIAGLSFDAMFDDSEPLMTVAQHDRIAAVRVAEVEELDGLVKRLGDLLSQVAIVLRGPEPALTRYGYADLPQRVKALMDERDAAQAKVTEGWRVMHCTSSSQREGDKWEVYDPQGSGGVVSAHDVRDRVVRGLLDALAAAPQPAKGE